MNNGISIAKEKIYSYPSQLDFFKSKTYKVPALS